MINILMQRLSKDRLSKNTENRSGLQITKKVKAEMKCHTERHCELEEQIWTPMIGKLP